MNSGSWTEYAPKISNSNLSGEKLSKSLSSIPHNEVGVWIRHTLQCFLQYNGLIVHHLRNGDLSCIAGGFTLASFGDYMHLCVADRCQYQLADLQCRQECTPE